MALRFDHRISYDADIFLHDAQILPYISPRLNDITGALSDEYTEQANGLKITTKFGDIDFVVAADITGERPVQMEVAGLDRTVAVQTPAEILAKKIQYRGFKFTHRDMFDLAMLLEQDRDSVTSAVSSCAPIEVAKALEVMRDRLPTFEAELPDYVNPTRAFTSLVGRATGLIKNFITKFD